MITHTMWLELCVKEMTLESSFVFDNYFASLAVFNSIASTQYKAIEHIESQNLIVTDHYGNSEI